MNPPKKHPQQAPGFALPMVMIATAAIFLLVIALIATNTLERKTARSYSDTTRAEFAVEAGLAIALANLSEVACRDDSLVFRLEDPQQPTVPTQDRPLGYRNQAFTYGAIFRDDAWQAIPLFSGADRTTLGNRELQTDALRSQLTSYTTDAEILGQLTPHTQQIPRAQWVELPADPENPAGHRMRYAFWIEDLSGRVPGKATNKTPRAAGLSTGEIDISTILDPELETGLFPDAMQNKRDTLRTPASLRHLLPSDQAARLEPHIHYHSPPPDQSPPRLIPQGFGYADAGLQAPDLNTFVENADVDGLANHIKRNLPEFENRKGGFPDDQDYLKTLAASIIDYADTDQDATIGSSYRGVDSYPFVNEMYDRYEITNQTEDATEITVETYIELWNPCQQNLSGEVNFTNTNKMRFSMPPNDPDEPNHQFTTATFPPQEVSIPANGFRVLYVGEKTYSFPHAAGIPARLTFKASSQNNFELEWNGSKVDTSRNGVERTGGFLDAAPLPSGNEGYTYNWKGNGSPTHNLNASQTGDPRASYYVDSRIRNHIYSRSNWGGRAEKRGGTTPHTYEVRPSDWPDRGNDSTPGTQPPNDQVRPISKTTASSNALEDGTPYPDNQPEMAPAFISNHGSYRSLAELGNIFDPAQWENIEDKSNHAPDKKAGGGLSLAIGRPEFPPFDQDGLRAAQLLDTFSLAPDPAVTSPPASHININTAPHEVLRALVAGLSLNADPANPETAPPKETLVGDLFAHHIISHRSRSPLRGLSDLNMIAKEGVSDPDLIQFFGNPAAYPDGEAPPESWDDAGREELFRKIIGMVGFHSRTFRIVVEGEVIDQNNRLLSSSAREYHFRISPARDAEGVILPDAPITFTKLYESTL